MGVSPVMQAFFERYEESRNTFDQALIESQYADTFMFAGPAGARATDKPAVLAALARGRELFKTRGHKMTRLVAVSETSIDERYTLVRAQFVWRFEKEAAHPIDVDVDSTFILYVKDAVPRIVFQHEHEDFQQALRARGVLPA